jgi:hypothetical protein
VGESNPFGYRQFFELVRDDIACDPELGVLLHQDALDHIAAGGFATGEAMLRDYFGEEPPPRPAAPPPATAPKNPTPATTRRRTDLSRAG